MVRVSAVVAQASGDNDDAHPETHTYQRLQNDYVLARDIHVGESTQYFPKFVFLRRLMDFSSVFLSDAKHCSEPLHNSTTSSRVNTKPHSISNFIENKQVFG